jgi:hypothetical protein
MALGSAGVSSSMHRFTVGATRRPDPEAVVRILTRDRTLDGIDAVVVSGDIGWSGQHDDYKEALVALQGLRSHWPDASIIVVPGNHDVDIRAGVDFDRRQASYEELLREFYGADLDKYLPFIDDPPAYGLTHREALAVIHQLGGRGLVVGVNSSALQNTSSVPIAVSSAVLEAVQDRLERLTLANDALRVFTLHHHLMPFIERPWASATSTDEIIEAPDPTMVANSARVQDWLARNYFGLVLHGHKHLAHGREDRLWAGNPSKASRRLVVVGAGSCGVNTEQREHGEPLSYNRIEASQLAGREWRIRVAVQVIDETQSPFAAVEGNHYLATAGASSHQLLNVFESRGTIQCHAEMALGIEPDRPLRNFISSVMDHRYEHPPTLRVGESHPAIESVQRSFRSLHPEFSQISGWDDHEGIQARLSERRFRIEHGSRMFLADANGRTPIDSAVKRLVWRPTWAYLALYRLGIDTEEEPPPLPGLMSIQFVPNEPRHAIDVIATFRNLELSFWWGVNMYELSLLLEYAVQRCGLTGYSGGAITVFAATATWKSNPEPVFTAELDDKFDADFVSLAIDLSSGSETSLRELRRLLDNKESVTSRNNVELSGLRQLSIVLNAVSTSTNSAVLGSVQARVAEALRLLSGAERYSDNVRIAKIYLKQATTLLPGES